MEVIADNQLLFAYGTLMDSEIQEKLLGRVLVGEADRLVGYGMGHITLGEFSFRIIRPQNGEIIDGVVLSVNNEDLVKMDIYETAAYIRKEVNLLSGKIAWAYIEP